MNGNFYYFMCSRVADATLALTLAEIRPTHETILDTFAFFIFMLLFLFSLSSAA
jgi:hypothetical protein